MIKIGDIYILSNARVRARVIVDETCHEATILVRENTVSLMTACGVGLTSKRRVEAAVSELRATVDCVICLAEGA